MEFKCFKDFKKEIFPKMYRKELEKKAKENPHTYAKFLANELFKDLKGEK